MYYKNLPDFSYAPFVVPGSEYDGCPYIVRLAPQDDKIEFEWVDLANKNNCACTAYLSVDCMTYTPIAVTSNKVVLDVPPERDCRIYLQTEDGRKSNTRPFRSGFYPGKMISYVHPEDFQYGFSGRYLCSPSILKWKDGSLFASVDILEASGAQNLSFLYRSYDGGKTWNYVTDIFPSFWNALFEHHGKMYSICASREFGDLQILESCDEGKTWHGTIITRAVGHWKTLGYHKGSCPVIKHNGRIWVGLEYGTWTKNKFMFTVASVDENTDIMNAENWTQAEFYTHDNDVEGTEVKYGGIESNVVVAPNGDILSVIRHGEHKALVLSVDKNNPQARLQFKEFIDFPLAFTKFHIQKKDDTYYAMGNPSPFRNVVDLYVSKDLHEWKKEKTLLDYSHMPANQVGVQYPTYIFDGDKMLTLVRVAYNGADSYHNSNAFCYFEFNL